MHHACHHAFEGSAAFPGPTAFHSDPISLLSSIGPMAFLGMLLLGVLGAVYFLMWATQQHEPAHADIGAIAERGGHPRQREVPSEDGPRVSFAHYDQPSQARQAPYEQPLAQYPEMPLDELYPPEPGKYD